MHVLIVVGFLQALISVEAAGYLTKFQMMPFVVIIMIKSLAACSCPSLVVHTSSVSVFFRTMLSCHLFLSTISSCSECHGPPGVESPS